MDSRAESDRLAGLESREVTGRLERVKTLLRTREELCALDDLYGAALANGRNDISTLCLKRGWVIKKWNASHDRETHKHYQLVREGEIKAKQMALIA